MGIGVVLMQEEQPIVYLIKHLNPKNLGLSVYEKQVATQCPRDSGEMETFCPKVSLYHQNGSPEVEIPHGSETNYYFTI